MSLLPRGIAQDKGRHHVAAFNAFFFVPTREAGGIPIFFQVPNVSEESLS